HAPHVVGDALPGEVASSTVNLSFTLRGGLVTHDHAGQTARQPLNVTRSDALPSLPLGNWGAGDWGSQPPVGPVGLGRKSGWQGWLVGVFGVRRFGRASCSSHWWSARWEVPAARAAATPARARAGTGRVTPR